MKHTPICWFLILLFIGIGSAFTQTIETPEARFGFQVGTDRKLIDWPQIHDYFWMLDGASDRILVQELGKSTLDKPFIFAIISSEDNLRNIDRLQKVQKQIAHPQTMTEEADALIDEAKAVVFLSLNIHATEIGSSQESVELAWELVTRTDEKVQRILDNVIILMIPSVNPDGLQMIVDWYREHVGTPHEGCSLPWLYHHYAGHDNNRDWFFFNLQETRLAGKILYHDWFPEIVYDQHQMGSSGARFFVPPYVDPINLNVHPILYAEMNMLGKHVVSDLQDQGFTGVETGNRFNAFFQGVMARTPIWHNMLGILSEAASVRIATPIYLPRGSLGSRGPERPRYSHRTDFIEPWPGGWWRLRDIIEYEKAAAYSILDLAATHREKFVRNFYNMNVDAIEKGKNEPPYAYVLPLDQHDASSAAEMMKRLRFNGVNLFRAKEEFQVQGVSYPAGTFVIPLSQPCRPAIKDLMEPQVYPNLMQYPGGPPNPPYDFTGWTLPLQMGVQVVEMKTPIDFQIEPTEDLTFNTKMQVDENAAAFLVDRGQNHSYILVNELFKKSKSIYWTDVILRHDDETVPSGTFIIPNKGNISEDLKTLSQKYDLSVKSIAQVPPAPGNRVKAPRLAMYQPWTGSMDEGWTRLVLDNFHFKSTPLHNAEIKKGQLRDSYDVIILPSIRTNGIVDGTSRWRRTPTIGTPKKPKKYQGGIGSEGTKALLDFVKEGGTLITLGEACNFAIEKFHLPATNVLKNVDRKDHYAPGTLLQIELDTHHPLAYGMPTHPAIRVTNSPAFRLRQYHREIPAVGYYLGEDLLLSGWLIGEDRLAGNTVLAEIPVEKGRVILYGFGVQSRGQTYGTFKLLFNGILTSNTSAVDNLQDALR